MWLGPALVDRGEHFSVEVCRCGIRPELLARAAFAILPVLADMELVIVVRGDRLFRRAFWLRRLLGQESLEAVFAECVSGRVCIVAGECTAFPFLVLREGDSRIPDAAGMDCGQLSIICRPLDLWPGAAVSGQAQVKLILAVFGIAVLLVIVWECCGLRRREVTAAVQIDSCEFCKIDA